MHTKKISTYLKMVNGDFLDSADQNVVDMTIDLVVADPPYFKVINETWDSKWSTIHSYMEWSNAWLTHVSSKMRYGGSLFIFGYFRNLAAFLALAEKHGLAFRQQIIIDKGMKSVAGRKTSTYKMFPTVTESVLFFIKDNRKVIKPILKNRALELNLSSKEINERLGVKSNGGGMWSIYTGKNMCEQFPTKATWEKLMTVLDLDIKYTDYAQTFHPIMGLTDVWTDIEFYANNRIHPTEKPYKLIERLIQSTTNVGDNVLDPFSGSGVTGLASSNSGRNAILFEIDEQYYAASKERFDQMAVTYDCIK